MLDTLDFDDPNFVAPTRPPSALSNASDASYFALYDEADSGDVDLPRRTVIETMHRYGQRCMLCGAQDDLVVTRVILQHAHPEEPNEDPVGWLKAIRLIPQDYSRDDWTNLMTLCFPHAQAYDEQVWRWIPGAAFREDMAKSVLPLAEKFIPDDDGDVVMADDVTNATTPAAASDSASDDDGLDTEANATFPGPAQTLVDDGFSEGARNPEIHFQLMDLPSFDVLVFSSDRMPSMSIHGDPVHMRTETRVGPGKSASVWRDWRRLLINPHVALASALPILDTGRPYTGDGDMFQPVREECLAICARWRSEGEYRRE